MKPTSVRDMTEIVGLEFQRRFSRTPLRQRLDDILGEAIELSRFTDIRNLKEEAGDLLSSTLALCFENDWDAESLVRATLDKIEKRKDQYASLGRKIKVAIYGGAFDPITKGHIAAAKLVLNSSKEFDEVWLVPCFRHMSGKRMAPAKDRLEMCKRAAEADGRIRVSDYEIANELGGETYQMVKRLQDEDFAKNKYDFSIMIGQDNANTMRSWPNSEDLQRMIRHVVVPRIGYGIDPSELWYMRMPHIYIRPEGDLNLLEVSSTQARAALATGDSKRATEILDPQVLSYIMDTGIYHEKR